MVVMGSYRTLTGRLEAMSRAANAAKALRSGTCVRLYLENTLLERLAQDLQHVTAELRELIQTQNTMVRPRHVAR
jgi:hypothetical protein